MPLRNQLPYQEPVAHAPGTAGPAFRKLATAPVATLRHPSQPGAGRKHGAISDPGTAPAGRPPRPRQGPLPGPAAASAAATRPGLTPPGGVIMVTGARSGAVRRCLRNLRTPSFPAGPDSARKRAAHRPKLDPNTIMPKNVTRLDITRNVSRRIGLGYSDTSRIVASALETICDRLARGEDVRLSGFGAFRVVHRAERQARNPKTGDAATVPARSTVVLRASPVLRNQVENG